MVAIMASDALATKAVGHIHSVLHSPAANDFMQQVHALLRQLGVPPPYPDAERLAIALATGLLTLLAYFVFFGKRHHRRRKRLQEDLDKAIAKVQELEEKLTQLEVDEGEKPKGEIRIWMDGAFDMMHYGHMNAFRQAASLGTYLVVGVNDDESITACKGAPPVLNNEERIASVVGCKFVNEVEPHCPYIMNEEYLKRMIKKHRIDYVVHGDDPCIVDGKDVYETAQKLGKYRTIPRTEGVSTSDILGRMLLMHKTHHKHEGYGNGQLTSKVSKQHDRPSKFLTTNRMLRLFSAGNRAPRATERIVYIDGAFDMFHAGHVEILKLAKQEGDYLIVGVHNDDVVNAHRGMNYPIMNLHERVLSVLGCKYVDDVLIDAPWQVTKEMVASLNISVVVHGTHRDSDEKEGFALEQHYRYAIEKGIYKQIESPSKLDVRDIVNRINDNRERFEKKLESKMKAEQEYYDDRYANKTKNALGLSARFTRRAPAQRLHKRFLATRFAHAHQTHSTSSSAGRLLALVAATTALSGSVAFAGAARKMESPEAQKAEEYYNDAKYDRRELLEYLKKEYAAHPADVGIIWRLTRAAYDVANLKATPAEEKKELTYYAQTIIQKGLELTDSSADIHVWFGIILSSIGDYEGSKVSIANSFKIKSHWEKAIELNPNKAVTYHLLGRWCVAIADLSWLERKAAAVLFGTPPESSYQEAIDFLLKYENLSPGKWKKNVFLISQVYYKMKDWENSKQWTQKALDMPIETEEDQTVHDDATAQLKKF
ncbi:TPA: hypothetical protein N0F65_004182 [Lagenidium giganteum]|uniref:ethanolamine-phosphate cytidylyltransferase n=1 Tax=Lagenidium giganteum TaxID=4803 RepID=A0AAV2YM51_9STRA|nr:TPA: hypothetical protein N0F65_004182 [Lagenidium giganteum]